MLYGVAANYPVVKQFIDPLPETSWPTLSVCLSLSLLCICAVIISPLLYSFLRKLARHALGISS